MIDKSAIVEKGVIIGKNVEIGPFCVVKKGVKLANGVKLISHVHIEGDTDIGENTTIYPFSSIGTPPQDLSYNGENVKLIIGKNNIIRENVLINPGTAKENYQTIIGDNNLLMGSTHIAHDAILGNNIVMVNQAMVAGHVRVGDNVVIGGATPIHQFVHIGEGSMIGGASAVSQDIPPFCLAEGNRAILKGLNLIGLRRRGIDRREIDLLKESYKKLFRQNRILKEVATEILKINKSIYVKKLCEFILNTKRGIPYERIIDEKSV